MSKILIKGGRVIDPESGLDEITDLLVVDEEIKVIGNIETDPDAKVIDARGKLVMPGAIDLHVHLRDMEQADKETVVSGTKAARKGGVTTVFAMPNTRPPLGSREAIERYQELIKDARVETHIIGAITKDLAGRELADIDEYPGLGIRFISDDG
ncbi:MAG: amidohydrolase family protein, partial [Candidatus Peregrinibacteria bacterium]|nr:amidohydrolase family protein [Candidatus Peregrinibacteria bacterium]